MKILIVSDAWHPQINGVVRTYEYLRDELISMGHDVKVIGPSDFSHSYALPTYNEIRLTLCPYARLRLMIMDYAPDLLHIATEGPLGLAARKYAARYDVKFTSCYHTHFPDYAAARFAKILPLLYKPVRTIAIRYMRWFHGPSSCLLVATQSLEDTLRAWGFTCPMKRMTRGVDYTVFHTGDKTLFNDVSRPVMLYVGRVAMEKNLEAFLITSNIGTKVIVGTGPDEAALKEQYPNVIFAGKKTGEELADHYRSADLFVFPSRTDTFGMVIVEAMACGLPVAAYPVTGPKDIIGEPLLGALDENLDTAIQNALRSPGSAAERAAHARNHYSWHKAAQQFLDIE